jgi:hypothetical protein
MRRCAYNSSYCTSIMTCYIIAWMCTPAEQEPLQYLRMAPIALTAPALRMAPMALTASALQMALTPPAL